MSNDSLEPNPATPKAKGIPIWYVLGGLLVLVIAAIAVLGYILRQASNDKLKLERQVQAMELEKGKAEIEKQKAAESAKLAMARTRQTEALAQVRIATNACTQLLQNLTDLEREAASLKTSEAGRKAARHPDLVLLAKRLYEVDLREMPQRNLAVSKLEGVRRLESQLTGAAGTGFEPDASFTSTAQSETIWANQELNRVQRARSLIQTLVQEGEIKLAPPGSEGSSTTLEAAIEKLSQREVAARQEIIAVKAEEANRKANTSLANAESEKIVQEAKLKAEKILEEAKANAAKQEQELLLKKAEASVEESKTKVAINQAVDEATKVQLRAKAKDPKIQAKLAPFTTPGYAQFGPDSYEKAPLSYSAMMQYGALMQSTAGMQKLVNLARTREDKVRPRWHFRLDDSKGWLKSTEEREMIKETQELLIELGPTLVEMGLLQK